MHSSLFENHCSRGKLLSNFGVLEQLASYQFLENQSPNISKGCISGRTSRRQEPCLCTFYFYSQCLVSVSGAFWRLLNKWTHWSLVKMDVVLAQTASGCELEKTGAISDKSFHWPETLSKHYSLLCVTPGALRPQTVFLNPVIYSSLVYLAFLN